MSWDLQTSQVDTGQLACAVIDANRDFYRQISAKYDLYESCARDPFFQSMLECDIDLIASELNQLSRQVHCVDCGAGTGNITLKLLRRGWKVTAVDVSQEMLGILGNKCKQERHTPTLVNDSVEHFFKTVRDQYDLVTFGSVLHHLFSYEEALELAISSIRSGGILYANFDPVSVKNPILARAFDTVDTFFAKAIDDPADILPGIWRRLRKVFGRHHLFPDRRVASPGDLAEFHVKTGIDDVHLKTFLSERGLTVIAHSRYPYARTALMRRLNRRVQALQSFRLICRRDR